MAFNPSDYVKSTSKKIGERIVDSAISNATTGLPINTISAATSTAQSLLNAGSSFQTIQALASLKTDSLGSASALFFALAGVDPSRVSEADLTNLRRQGDVKSEAYYNDINPTTKIARKRGNR